MLDVVFDIRLRISWAQISGPDSLGYNEEKVNLGPNTSNYSPMSMIIRPSLDLQVWTIIWYG